MREGFEKYLALKEILTVNVSKHDFTLCDAAGQIRLLGEFHRKAAGYREYPPEGLGDNLGRDIEKYKADIRKFKGLLRVIKKEGEKNTFEEVLSKTGGQIATMAEKAVAVSSDEGYLNIIKRSMDKAEICLGNPYFENLYREGDTIKCNINNCTHDLVESDGLAFFRKLRRKGVDFDQEKLIDEFCSVEQLGCYSREYISSLMQYPYYIMKTCIRYKENKNPVNPEQYLEKYRRDILFDGIKMRL